MRGNNGSGSGFIINSDGFIVTNEHVVRGALNQKVQVIMWSGRILEGYVHSMDEKTDIALVKIINSGGEKFPHAILGSSGDVRQGEFVLALGSPFSQYFRNTVTFGIVSALARNTIDSSKHVRLSYIQTDANMHPGNSGGPLINLDGHVIGVCNSRCERVPTFNFAIPIDIVAIAVDQLMRNKRVVLPYIGLRFQQAYEGSPQPLSRKVKERLIVKSVEPSSPAELAGIQG
jgi:S1-C subfamily serine protease